MPLLTTFAGGSVRGFGRLRRVIAGAGGATNVVEIFTESTTWTCPAGVTEVEYLVLAGGGGGSNGAQPAGGGGGGGAGGYRAGTGLAVTAGQTYTVTLGAGGGNTSNGSNSLFSTITSSGGGSGGSRRWSDRS